MGRLAFDMTDAMEKEIDRVLKVTDLQTKPEVFRRAFTLLRIHIDAEMRGERIYRESDSDVRDLIILPFNVVRGK